MPTYKTSYNGKTLRLTADTPEQAATAARLYFAGRGKADDVAAEANQQGQAAIRDKGLDDPLSPEFQALRERGEMEGTAAAAGPTAAILGAGALGGVAPAGFIPGMIKDTAIYGAAEGAEKLLGLPSWTGELIGAVSPAKSIGKLLLGGVMGGAKKGAATAVAKSVAPEITEEAAKRAARKAEIDLAIREGKLADQAAKRARDAELHQVKLERLRAPRTPKAGPKPVPEPAPAPRTEGATALKPEPEFIPDEAVSLVAEPLPFRPRGSTKPATNLGGKAKPGPAPTPPDKLEETLRASLDAIAEKKASKGALQAIAEKVETSPLQGPRIQVGAQRVGRQVGMTKEEVRQQAGPVLDEVRGEASPILPIEPFRKIIDTMKAIPPAEREAYVARATSGKAKWQIENIRRTLEHLGLLLPVGAAVGAASSE